MKQRWAVLGVVFGVGIGVALSATLGAFDVGEKERRVLDRTAVEVQAQQTGTATTDTKFVEIDPVRAFDSRVAAYPQSGIFVPSESRIISVKDGHDAAGNVTLPNAVPAGATAISYNITVASAAGPNFFSVTPGNGSFPASSAINFNGTADVANAGIVAIDGNRSIKIWMGNQAGSAHTIIDVTGYFVKPLYAEVNSDGTLKRGSRVVSVTKVFVGEYAIKFDRNVADCSYSATIGTDFAESAGLIDIALFGGTDTVTVFTQNPDGTPPPLSDRAFHLVVTC